MKANGRLRTCDRCGETVFEPKTGKDGTVDGYTRWDLFEEAIGWGSTLDFSDLCPACMEKWDKLITDFKSYNFEFNKES